MNEKNAKFFTPQEEAAQEIAERLANDCNLSTDEIRGIIAQMTPQELTAVLTSTDMYSTGYISMGYPDSARCIRGFLENRLSYHRYTTKDLQNAKRARELVDMMLKLLNMEVGMSAPKRKDRGLPPIKTGSTETLLILATLMICNATDIGVIYSGGPHIVARIYETHGDFSGIWQVLPNTTKAGDVSSPLMSMIYNIIYSTPKASLARDVEAAVKAEIFNRANTEKYARPNAINNDLIFANNGVIDLSDGATFTPYNSPEYMEKYDPYYTPLRKIDTNYNPAAVPPPYFDPIAFINSLFVRNTPAEVKIADASVNILLRAMQFTIRGFSGLTCNGIFLKNTASALTSDDRSGLRGAGKNGKSTFLELLTNLIDHTSDAYLRNNSPEYNTGGTGGNRIMRVDISALDKSSFTLNPDDLRLAYMMMADDPDTHKAWTGSEYLKNILRGQPVRAERKFCDSEALPLRGVLYAATNGEVNFSSKDQASTTHQIHINFTRRFNGTACDPKIKNTYIAKKEVLEYLLKILVDLPYADDFAPEDIAALDGNIKMMRLYNSPTQAFFEEIFQEVPYGRIPTDFIFEMYGNYCDKNKDKPLDRRLFEDALAAWIAEHSDNFGFVRRRGRLSSYEKIWLASHPWEILADYGTDKRGAMIECCASHAIHDSFLERKTFATITKSSADKRYNSFVICYPMLELMEKSKEAGRMPWYNRFIENIWCRILTDYSDKTKYTDITPYDERDMYRAADTATGEDVA